MAAVCGHELFVRQRRDCIRIASGIEAISGIGKKLAGHFGFPDLGDVTHSAFHFIENHALVDILTIRVRFNMPAFLAENPLILENAGAEYCIQIDAGEIQEVLIISASNGIHGHIREGHGIKKGIHRAL